MSVYDLIKHAIVNKKQVIATYDGYHREMCPHVIGEKNGVDHCLFYQFGGESSSGVIVPSSRSNWRCMNIYELENVRVVDGPWHTADNHSRPQTCVDDIDIEVKI